MQRSGSDESGEMCHEKEKKVNVRFEGEGDGDIESERDRQNQARTERGTDGFRERVLSRNSKENICRVINLS